ncbi:MAG: hypothetical protein J5981_05430 [Lachnospira sp.]|nr:hypothetical protein [Lachnospira sp.]
MPLKEGAPGHGCGHNILGTGAVMAGIALKNVLEYSGVPGIVRLYGTPYEEASVGKPLLGKAGAFENLDFVLDWHPHGGNYAYYEVCNSVFVLNFTFKGKKSHGARPWLGRSAFDAAMATETQVKAETVTYTHNKLPNKVLSKVVYDNLVYYGAPDYTEEEQEFVKKMQCEEGVEPTGLDMEIKPYGPGQTGITDASEYS